MASTGAGARAVYGLVLTAVYAVVLWQDFPGFLSVDSVISLHEGRFGVKESWNPALFGWVLGLFDRVWRGAGLYMAAMAAMFFASLWALAKLRPRTSWLGPLVAAGLLAMPQVVIYQGIVWKDVAFANCALAGFVLLALAARAGRRAGAGGLVVAAVLFAAAGLFRQNGLLLVVPAALALAWASRSRGWLRSLGGALVWALIVGAFSFALSIVAQPQGASRPDGSGSKGVRLVQTYDLVAAAVREPGRPMLHIADANKPAADYIRANAARLYNPERIDDLNEDPKLGALLAKVPSQAIHADWVDLVALEPALYARVRLDHFRWVLATPIIDRCLPVYLGVDGPAKQMKALGLQRRWDQRDTKLYNYATWFMDTPALSHLAWGALAILLLVFLLARRDEADIPVAAMLVGALGFSASFAAISLACDYRYLYFLDVSALAAAIYVALDPGMRRQSS